MADKKIIVLTGGGTAGHVNPNIALLPGLFKLGYEIHYIGTGGIEKALLARHPDVIFHEIHAGKLRRYFSLKTVRDFFAYFKGIREAKKLLRDLRPDVVFSKGGYVSVPVVKAAKGVCPVITHESDYTPGLANRMIAKSAKAVCCSFSDTLAYVKDGKGIFTGAPVRRELLSGSRSAGLSFSDLSGDKPVLLIMGGSLGAQAINGIIRKNLKAITERFDVIHICGRGGLDNTVNNSSYRQYEYIYDELKDVFACSDVMVSRAGAGAVFEILALAMPSLLIPLPAKSSRGDQDLNASYCVKHGFANVIAQDKAQEDGEFIKALFDTYDSRVELIAKIKADSTANKGVENVIRVIEDTVNR